MVQVEDPNSPVKLQELPFPVDSSGGGYPCTQFTGTAVGDWTGALTLSRSGKLVTLPCWAVTSQSSQGTSAFPSSSYPRVVARVYQDGTVDTSQGITGEECREATSRS